MVIESEDNGDHNKPPASAFKAKQTFKSFEEERHVCYEDVGLAFDKTITSLHTRAHIIRVSNSLDPDKARRIVGPDLGPSCLPRLSAD